MNPPDPPDFVPERILDPRRRPSWAERLSVGLTDGAAALLLNGVVIGVLLHHGWPLRETAGAPNAISVELVKDIPKPEAPPAPKKPDTPAAPPQPEAPKPKTALETALALPEAPPPPPPAPAPQAAPPLEATAEAQASPTAPAPAAPPPLDTKTSDPTPHLVEAPPAPTQAATQAERNEPGNAMPEVPKMESKAAPAPETPPVLRTIEAPESAPATAPKTEAAPKPAEPTPAETHQAEMTARLAAALPFSQSFVPDTFRGALSAQGSAATQEYRGAVYGAFKKAEPIVEAAKAKHLRGQAVIAFTIDDQGALVEARVAVSSGNPEVDATALAMIRASAPYPAPPPGAPRSFSPAIALGADEP